jgi:predicted nucleic acid-binding protein
LVIWDTNILALYFGRRLGQVDQLRMQGLVDELKRKREPIGIPAQVWAEFLDEASPQELEKSQAILKTAAFKFLPYDMRAAFETVQVSHAGRAERKKQGSEKRARQAVKVDWQIIAIAKVNNARLLLTNDEGMRDEAKKLGLNALRIADLEIPDALRQHSLQYDADQDEDYWNPKS